MLYSALMIKPPLLAHGRRLAGKLRPHCVALAVCACFALAGAAVLDDYGIGPDSQWQRRIGSSAISHALSFLGVDYTLVKDYTPAAQADSYYGVAFEIPLVLAERLLGLSDTRSIHLTRHIITHLFFIAAGFCCYLLAYRLSRSRLLALLALLFFLLHPRIYAHSFLNSKDLPMLSMFVIALYLLERAFRKDTVKAFILLGVAVGLLTNIRIVGAMLFPVVLAMRGLDLASAAGPEMRKHILTTGAAFALAAILVLYATWPWLWSDPLGHFLDSFAGMARFNNPPGGFTLFRGEWISARDAPPDYIPVWFAITTPPLTLALGLAGVIATMGYALARPAALLRNTRLRCGFLLLACFALPPLAVIILEAVLYNHWRHLYFIYAPFCLLASLGLYWLVSTFSRRPRWRAAVYGLTGVGIGLIALQMVQLHPDQNVYFNFLVDRATPERLRTQFRLDYVWTGHRRALEYLLERHPGTTVHLKWPEFRPESVNILPAADRQRLVFNSDTVDPDYILLDRQDHWPGDRELPPNVAAALQPYNNTAFHLASADSALMDTATIAAYQEFYFIPPVPPIVKSHYTVYLNDRTVFFIRENCQPGDLAKAFGVKVYRPDTETSFAGAADTWNSQLLKNYGGSFQRLKGYGVRLGDRCMASIPLPDYAAGDLLVGQYKNNLILYPVWEELYNLGQPGWREALATWFREVPQPTVRAAFDIYRRGGALLYHRETCSPADVATRFFLHIVPIDPARLPPQRAQYGFDNRDFHFYHTSSTHYDGQCAAYITLPDYPIAQIRTGQFTPEQGQLWAIEFTVE